MPLLHCTLGVGNSSACPVSGTTGLSNTAGMGALGTTDSCQLHSQTASFPAGQTSHCMTPFHSTAADHTSTRAMERKTLPAPQTQNQRETKTPWGTHCPAEEHSAMLEFLQCPTRGHPAMLDILPAEWRPGGSQCLRGAVIVSPAASLEQKGKGSSRLSRAGNAIARPQGLQLVWAHIAGVLMTMCGCHHDSISLEAQLGDASLGRGMSGGRQDRAFSL